MKMKNKNWWFVLTAVIRTRVICYSQLSCVMFRIFAATLCTWPPPRPFTHLQRKYQPCRDDRPPVITGRLPNWCDSRRNNHILPYRVPPTARKRTTRYGTSGFKPAATPTCAVWGLP